MKVKNKRAAAQPIAGTLTIRGTEYVVIPRAEYLKQVGGVPSGSVEAVPYVRASIGADLRAAREHAGLTQAELAAKLGKSQPMISQAEAGQQRIGARYIASVLKACGLPEDWKPAKGNRRIAAGARA